MWRCCRSVGPRRRSAARPEAVAGAALAVALRDGPVPVVVDCGRAAEPASRAVAEVADATVVVVRGCYLTLRRAVRAPALAVHDRSGARRGAGPLARTT